MGKSSHLYTVYRVIYTLSKGYVVDVGSPPFFFGHLSLYFLISLPYLSFHTYPIFFHVFIFQFEGI